MDRIRNRGIGFSESTAEFDARADLVQLAHWEKAIAITSSFPPADARRSGVHGAYAFRSARPSDAIACAPLIHESGAREFRFFLGVPPERCIAFLRGAFASHHGRFSWRRHHVATAADGAVLSMLAAHDGRAILFDDLHIVWMLLRFFGLRHTAGCLLRGWILERELPAPKRRQTLIAHCATDERVRGTGLFSALFDDARRAGLFAEETGRDVILDVLVDNTRAHTLYRRLGFRDLARARAVSKKLPAELVSIRMRLEQRVER